MTLKPWAEKASLPPEPFSGERPSQRMLRTWAKRIRKGSAIPIPVYVGGAWSLQVLRGHKRVLQLSLPGSEKKEKRP